MKRSIVAVLVGILVLAGLGLWALEGSIAWNGREIVMAGIALVLVGLAIYF